MSKYRRAKQGETSMIGWIQIMKCGCVLSTGLDYVCSGTLGPLNLHLCYYQKASDQLHIGVEMETNLRNQEAVGTIGYYADLPKADLQFRGLFVLHFVMLNPFCPTKRESGIFISIISYFENVCAIL